MDELNMFRTDVRSLEMARGAWLARADSLALKRHASCGYVLRH